MTLVYLDTETTGLDPERHHVWEIAWALDDGPILSTLVPHTLAGADPKALELNGYYERITETHEFRKVVTAEGDLRNILEGATVVGSNPAFDTAFLRHRWGVAPWHHRLLDVAAYGMGVLNRNRPEGLASVAGYLRQEGHDIPEPDHTAAGDVACLRATFKALQRVRMGAHA